MLQNMHGKIGGQYNWANPIRTVDCNEKSRPEYTNTRSHEYNETPEVFEAKIKVLSQLILESKFCIAYVGAGLSCASGLDDYATKSPQAIAARPHVSDERGSGFLTLPNTGHKVLTRLYQKGLLKKCVSQNHDGLLQKSGFPQHAVNEIHGGWFDPSNPGGNQLRHDLFDEILVLEKNTDLCLALGSSLSGLNADRLAKTPASKYPKKGNGLVIINLQETQLDDIATLRIFGKLDEVMGRLAQVLDLPELPEPLLSTGSDIFANLPYDPTTGEKSSKKTCSLKLSEGSKIRVTCGNYGGCKGVVGKKNPQGHWNVQVFVPLEDEPSIVIPNDHLLGSWWLIEAHQGLIPRLPVVQDF